MRLPTVAGVIDRRLLVNFTLDPELASQLVPAPFRPQLVNGRAVAGICLIRLTNVRPAGAPASFGVSSENAAHRIAVTWDEDGNERTGVFIPRRDTSSRINALLGGRIFPGIQYHADFNVEEAPPNYKVSFESDDGGAFVSVAGRVSEQLPEKSIFSSVSEASAFFENGAAGYSVTHQDGRFDGLELDTQAWRVEPLEVVEVRSSVFDGLPPGSAEFDSALIMRGIEHEWRALEPICAA